MKEKTKISMPTLATLSNFIKVKIITNKSVNFEVTCYLLISIFFNPKYNIVGVSATK